ncbi:MAG: hypothetical protein HY077_14415 [Elusimicrobia bacterium]|nr:hypothetical protein [Elusimicrobiota bacterium]
MNGITLKDTVTGLPVAGMIGLSQDGVIATFFPSQPLQPSRSYTIGVSTAVLDVGGNPLKQAFASSFQTQALGTLVLTSVNNSTAAINSVVAQPITVKALSSTSTPVAQVSVVFAAQMGAGTFQPSGLRQITVLTDATGIASATFQLGGQAVQNTVAITAVGFSSATLFSVTTLPMQATLLRIYSGNNQSGALGDIATLPLVVQAMDAGGDNIQGTTVTFKITQGQGSFNGQPTTTSITDSSGTASTLLTFGATPGPVLVQAFFDAMVGGAPVMNFFGIAPQPSSPTAVVGSVVDGITLVPLPGVIVYLGEDENISTTTDQGGRFRLLVSSGPHIIVVAGIDSGVIGGHTYPEVSYPVTAVQGQDTDLGIPSMLPELDPDLCINVSDVQGGTLTIKSHPLWKLILAPGQAHFADGTHTGKICAQFVRHDRIPMPVAGGKTSLFEDTVQPPDVTFNPPAQVTFPNDDNLKPGTVTEIFTLDYVTGVFKKTGRGLVTEDGTVLNSLPGQGITQGGWHLAPSPIPALTTCLRGLIDPGNVSDKDVITYQGASALTAVIGGTFGFLLCGVPVTQGFVSANMSSDISPSPCYTRTQTYAQIRNTLANNSNATFATQTRLFANLLYCMSGKICQSAPSSALKIDTDYLLQINATLEKEWNLAIKNFTANPRIADSYTPALIACTQAGVKVADCTDGLIDAHIGPDGTLGDIAIPQQASCGPPLVWNRLYSAFSACGLTNLPLFLSATGFSPSQMGQIMSHAPTEINGSLSKNHCFPMP